MFGGGYFQDDEQMAMYNMLQRGGMRGAPARRFDEYYRCYPMVMKPGPDRDDLNFGGKVIMASSALEKLSRMHVTWPVLFELTNGAEGKTSHAGVLEFTAEEGKIYLPHWMMQTLLLETGDLLQVKSTDLKPATLVKLQPQSISFLEITDPKAVLEKAFRSFSTLTKGDIFSFKYNDTVYEVAALEVKPESEKMGVCMLETDVSVDFAPPVGYKEPTPSSRTSGTSTPRSGIGLPAGGMMHNQGTMAQSINYDSIAPSATAALAGQRAVSSNFLLGGHKLNAKKSSKAPTPKPSTPVAGTSTNPAPAVTKRRTNGPQPLRLAPNKLFFGYEIKPVKTDKDREKENRDALQPYFKGQGQTLRGGKGKGKGKGDAEDTEMGGGEEVKKEKKAEPSVGRRLDGRRVL